MNILFVIVYRNGSCAFWYRAADPKYGFTVPTIETKAEFDEFTNNLSKYAMRNDSDIIECRQPVRIYKIIEPNQ